MSFVFKPFFEAVEFPETLGDLDDVAITSPATPSYLRYNGALWLDVPLSTVVSDINALLDHGSLLGLSDDDDHSQYLHLSPSTNPRNVVTPAGGVDGLKIRLPGNPSASQLLFAAQNSNGSTSYFSVENVGAGSVVVNCNRTLNLQNQSELRFLESGGTNYVGFKAPTTLGANQIWTLPEEDGASGQVLSTNGSGVLDWVSPSSVNSLDDLSDVSISGLSDGDLLVYDSGSGQWLNLPLSLSLSDLSDVDTTGADDGDVLTYVGGSVMTWLPQAPAGGGGTPGGSDGEIQYNNGGAFGGDAALTFDDSTKDLSLGTGQFLGASGSASEPTYSFSSDANSGLYSSGSDVVAISSGGLKLLEFTNLFGFGIIALTGATSISGNLTLTDESELQLREATGSGTNYVGFKAPTTLGANQIWTLPEEDGSDGDVLTTDGSGVLSWETPSGGGGSSNWTLVLKAANEDRISDTTLADDAALTFAVAANSTYKWRGVIHFTTAATPDFKYSWSYPTSPTNISVVSHELPGGTVGNDVVWVQTSAFSRSLAGTGTDGGVEFEGIITVGASAGAVTFQWAQNTNSGTPTSVLAGSYLEWLLVNEGGGDG